MKTISCNAAYGSGGMGQHLTQIVEDTRQEGLLARYYAPGVRSADEAGTVVDIRSSLNVIWKTPIRYSSGWKNFLAGDLYDRAVAKRLQAPVDSYLSFGGQALHGFRRAKVLGAQCLELLAANSHVNNVTLRHRQAVKKYPFEQSWLNEAQRRKTIQEYAMADVIHVASDYTAQSFLAEGVPASKLRRVHYETHPSFIPGDRPEDGIFRIVYTGSLTVMKGVPALLDAVALIPDKNLQLTLVGGWATRGMKRYLQERVADDPRILIRPGSPLAHLQAADAYVHPTFEDGWAYAPVEAMACGVPVIVTEDTGMKELVTDGVNGFKVPTGDVEAIRDRLVQLRDHPLRSSLPAREHVGRTIAVK